MSTSTSLVFLTPASCPFHHDTKITDKTNRLQLAPKRRAIMQASRPFCFESHQKRVERTHPAAEYVVTPASYDLAHETAQMAGPADNFLDGDALLRQIENGGAFFLIAQLTGMLPKFDASQ